MVTANIKNFAGECIRRLDFQLQSRLCLTRELHVEDPDAALGAGVYSAGEWGRARQARTEPFGAIGDRYASDAGYLRYLAEIHESKIRPVLSLIEALDFSRYRRIMELGCGDMPQAYTICSRYPDISYDATDFDARVIEQCSRLPLLAGIRKSVLDVVSSDLDALRNHDLIISWSLEFALEDRQLTGLFAACRRHCVPYLLCTHTAIGPIGYLSRAPGERKRADPAQRARTRRLGWLRSTGEIARLARQAGMTLQWKAYHVNHAALYFTAA